MTYKVVVSSDSELTDEVRRPRLRKASQEGCAPRGKILVIAAVDVMVWALLLPWVRELKTRGFEVHIACSPSKYFDRLREAGFEMHAVHLRRSFNLFAQIGRTA